MQPLFSQHDSSYDRTRLGKTALTIHSDGCAVTSGGNLFGKSPVELIKAGVVNDAAMTDFNKLAAVCGGKYLGKSQTPGKGWQIAVTDHYKDVGSGYPTHFFNINVDTGQMINPLDFPAVVKPIRTDYHIVEYRLFSGVTLDTSKPAPVLVFPDVEAGRWSEAAIKDAKDKGRMKGYDDGTFRPTAPVTREELAAVLQRL